MLLKILSENSFPVFFFDATGKVLKEINGQNKVFLYSLVFHDASKSLIMPLAEFFTTVHTEANIALNLQIILNMLKPYNICSLPLTFVTDQSWALMNAILEVFNKCTILDYLKWSFDMLTENIRGINFCQLF